MSPEAKPLGLRREVLFFLPTAVFLLILMAGFDLVVYRSAVEDFQQDRLEEAISLAERTAQRLSLGSEADTEVLRRLAPLARAAAVRDPGGSVSARLGEPLDLDLETLIGPADPSRALAFDTSRTGAPVVAAVAPFGRGGRTYRVQIDLSAERLATHVNSRRQILLVNAAVLGSLTLLVLLFLRHLLAPYDMLLRQARRLGGTAEEPADETQFLIQTFDRALEALRRPDGEESDDIAAIERTLAPSLESGFLLLDREGAVLSINDLGTNLLSAESIAPGTPLAELRPGREEWLDIVEEAVRSGTPSPRRECRIGAGGGERVIGLTVHPLRRDDGDLRGFIVLFADLTEDQALARQEQISKNLSQLGEIAAGVAHEMRNGLATLKGYLGLIEHSPDDGSVSDYLEEMRSESAHLERVLTDFLSFARPGSLRSEPLDLVDLVRRATADPALAEASFSVEEPSEPLRLVGDGQLLDRALRNLLQNAVEAQRDTGCEEPIGIRLRRDGEIALVEIEDRGPGLATDIRDSLFQPFVSGRPDGVGLGLALSHRIASLHEGTLDATDRGSGGTRLTLGLPVTIDT